MVSAIDPTVPVAGAPTTASVRANFLTAKNEITALQAASTISVPVSIAQGGTGAITNTQALTNLGAVPVAGGVNMTGLLVLSANPTAPLGAAPKQYVDAYFPVSIANGGTGATTPNSALANLGAASLASPAFTGTPTAPTAPSTDSSALLATTAFVHNLLGTGALQKTGDTATGLMTFAAGVAITSTPATTVTPPINDSTTSIINSQWYINQGSNVLPLVDTVSGNVGGSLLWARADHAHPVYTAGSFVYVGDTPPAPIDRELWWDSTGGQLYIRYNDGTSSQWVVTNTGQGSGTFLPLTGGTINPGPLVISANAAALPAGPTGRAVLEQLGALDGGNTDITIDAFGAGIPCLTLRRARGTAASPTATQSGDLIGLFEAGGYGATGYQSSTSSSQMSAYAAENWTNTAQGSYWQWNTTSLGTTGPALRMVLRQGLILGSGGGSDPGNGALILNANAAALPAPAAGTATLLQLGSADGNFTNVSLDSFGAAQASQLRLRRARGTAAAPTAAQNGDTLGYIIADARGATTFGTGAFISVSASENWSDTAHGSVIAFQTCAPGSASTTGRAFIGTGMVISSNGVTPDPGVGSLTLNANAAALPAGVGANGLLHAGAADGQATAAVLDAFGATAPGFITRTSGGTAAAPTANASSNILLTLSGQGYNAGFSAGAQINYATTEAWSSGHQGCQMQLFTTPTGTSGLNQEVTIGGGLIAGFPTGSFKGVGTINASAMYVNGAAVSVSDARLKENITQSKTDALAALGAIPLFDFDWKSTGEDDKSPRHHSVGFVAQEIPDKLEYLVVRGPTEDDMIGIDTLQMTAHLVRAVQQLLERIEALEGKTGGKK